MKKGYDPETEKLRLVERIKLLMEHYNLSQTDLCKICGISNTTLSNTLNFRSMGGYFFLYDIIINFPEINARWLLTGCGEMLLKPETNIQNSNNYSISKIQELEKENEILRNKISALINYINLNDNERRNTAHG